MIKAGQVMGIKHRCLHAWVEEDSLLDRLRWFYRADNLGGLEGA